MKWKFILCILLQSLIVSSITAQQDADNIKRESQKVHDIEQSRYQTSPISRLTGAARILKQAGAVQGEDPVITVEPTNGATTPAQQTGFSADFSTTESSMRTTIFQGDVAGVADILRSNKLISLGAGCTFNAQQAPLVVPSADRNRDPDVVAFKAVAQSALETGDVEKLATAVVLALRPDCTCAVFSAEETDGLRDAFQADLSNPLALQTILNADANAAERRKLSVTGKSPVNSFVCTYCWPIAACKKLHWC